MKLYLVAMAVFAGVSLVGCGESVVREEADSLAEVSQALCTVSASCPLVGTISCSGNQCSGQNGSHVTCDGNTTVCPPVCNASTTCSSGGVLSCQGTNNGCSSVPGTSVTCNGDTQSCCNGISCNAVSGRCEQWDSIDCCWSDTEPGTCGCNPRGYWICGSY